MKKINISKLDKNKIIDLMYEFDKNRYSVLIRYGERKEITKKEYFELLKGFNE